MTPEADFTLKKNGGQHQMSLAAGVWKVWRDAPGFWQRYTGVISADGTSINGAWEYSPDGVDWSHDFTPTYLAAAQPAPA